MRPAIGEKIARAEPLSFRTEWLDVVRKAMSAVVNEGGGTAGRARLGLPGVRLAGKTGTSQVLSTRGKTIRKNSELAWEERDHALFVCYAPAEKPRYAVSVVVEHGGAGSRAAAPLAREVMLDLLRRNPADQPGYRTKEDTPRTADADGRKVMAEDGA